MFYAILKYIDLITYLNNMKYVLLQNKNEFEYKICDVKKFIFAQNKMW